MSCRLAFPPQDSSNCYWPTTRQCQLGRAMYATSHSNARALINTPTVCVMVTIRAVQSLDEFLHRFEVWVFVLHCLWSECPLPTHTDVAPLCWWYGVWSPEAMPAVWWPATNTQPLLPMHRKHICVDQMHTHNRWPRPRRMGYSWGPSGYTLPVIALCRFGRTMWSTSSSNAWSLIR